jgi:Rrf2 family transcriptional regulator, cysteine metabolism repressor
MKLSTKTRYGTRALLDLALHQKGRTPVPLKDIAERQAISLNYLEHIVAPLVSGGLVNSTRGSKGGVALAKPAQQITLKEIVELLEGPSTLVECLVGSKICPRSSLCATQDLWNDIGKAIDGVLESTTLQDLAEKQKNKVRNAEMYYI